MANWCEYPIVRVTVEKMREERAVEKGEKMTDILPEDFTRTERN